MTQIFEADGRVRPATVLDAGPVVITQVKTEEKDKYEAIQVGFIKKKKVNRAQRISKEDSSGFRYLREFPAQGKERKVGDVIDVSIFSEGDKVVVSGISKGKGFQGVVKRHGFHGGPRSHGQKHSEREPGSIGATGPQRVFKGVRMGGRMGSDRVTVSGLKVLSIDKEKNEMLVSGSIPGHRGTLLEIRG